MNGFKQNLKEFVKLENIQKLMDKLNNNNNNKKIRKNLYQKKYYKKKMYLKVN